MLAIGSNLFPLREIGLIALTSILLPINLERLLSINHFHCLSKKFSPFVYCCPHLYALILEFLRVYSAGPTALPLRS